MENQQPAASAPLDQNKLAFILFGVLLGSLGIHNFVAGYKKKAIIQLCISVCTLFMLSIVSWIWAIIDICTVKENAKGEPFV